MDAAFERELRRFVEPYRMAGQDLEIDAPRPVPLEIALRVCVKPDHFRGDVKAALFQVFSKRTLPDGRRGLFHPDNFTFGQPVYLSQVYAAAQAVDGVASVDVTQFERQGRPDPQAFADGVLNFARLEIPRLDNDPSFPERGVFRAEHGRWEVRCQLSIDPTLRDLNDCGCCAGITAATPAAVTNRPGLSAVAYRIGEHATFKASMLAALSATRTPRCRR